MSVPPATPKARLKNIYLADSKVKRVSEPYKCLYDTHMDNTGIPLTLGILEGGSDEELLLL